MAKFFCPTKISENISETPEGYLLCKNVPICRTGVQDYGAGETPLEVGDDGIVRVYRDAEEVLSKQTIASFEGKAITIRHPDDFVGPHNWKELAKGTLHNVREAAEVGDDGESCVLADLLITDSFAIGLVQNGLREVSCGYEAEYEQTGPGKGRQTNIVGNHLALVEQGRAGSSYAIRDSKGKGTMREKILAALRLMSGGKTVDQALAEMEKTVKKPVKTLPVKGKSKDGKKGKAKDEGVNEGISSKTTVLHEMPTVDSEAYDELKKMYDELGDKLAALAPKTGDEDEEESEDEAEEQESHVSTEGKDEDPSVEERIKALEAAVTKILENKSHAGDEDEEEGEESEDEDGHGQAHDEDEEEGEESEDEDNLEGNEKGKKTGDAALAEILVPDFQAPKKKEDIRKSALKQAMKFSDTASVIIKLNGGKKPTFDSADKVNLLFNAATAIMKTRRGTGLEGSKSVTTEPITFETVDLKGGEGVTAERMNEMNKQHYAAKK